MGLTIGEVDFVFVDFDRFGVAIDGLLQVAFLVLFVSLVLTAKVSDEVGLP